MFLIIQYWKDKCSIRLKRKKRNIIVINVHIPSEEKEENEKEHLQQTTYEGKTYKFETVNNFVYLAVVIPERKERKLKARIAKGNRKYGSMKALTDEVEKCISEYECQKIGQNRYKNNGHIRLWDLDFWMKKWWRGERWEKRMFIAIYAGRIQKRFGWEE